MSECMTFPDTVEEFMEQYKVVDTEQVYTNGTEFVPIYRMRQWFQHEPERKKGEWIEHYGMNHECSECKQFFPLSFFDGRPFEINFCPNCGADMREDQHDQSK